MGWESWENVERRKGGGGGSVNEVYGMCVRRASAGRDLGKHQSSTALRMERTCEVHAKTLVLLNHLDSEWTLLPYNFLYLWSQGVYNPSSQQRPPSSVFSIHAHTESV